MCQNKIIMDSKDLQKGIKIMLGADSIIRRKNRSEKNKKKTLFINLIKKYDDALVRSMMMDNQFRLDLSSYEETFYQMIDDLILLTYGEDIYQLIAFYFFERLNDDGTENFIVGPAMEQIFIKNPNDLYDTIQKLYPGTF